MDFRKFRTQFYERLCQQQTLRVSRFLYVSPLPCGPVLHIEYCGTNGPALIPLEWVHCAVHKNTDEPESFRGFRKGAFCLHSVHPSKSNMSESFRLFAKILFLYQATYSPRTSLRQTIPTYGLPTHPHLHLVSFARLSLVTHFSCLFSWQH